jgi:hypothetical protein
VGRIAGLSEPEARRTTGALPDGRDDRAGAAAGGAGREVRILDGLVPPLIVAVEIAAMLLIRRTVNTSSARVVDSAQIVLLVTLVIGLELAMGRSPTYRHGPVRLWSGEINSDENSQQIADPYTFSHVIHGAAFYGITRVVLGPQAPLFRAALAIAIEAGWETYENTEQVIDRYRADTIALGYYGDSILNSVCDVAACGLGFVLAWKLPTRVTVAWVVAVEIALAATIRDNLTLNVLMLLHPIGAIKRWQMGG